MNTEEAFWDKAFAQIVEGKKDDSAVREIEQKLGEIDSLVGAQSGPLWERFVAELRKKRTILLESIAGNPKMTLDEVRFLQGQVAMATAILKDRDYLLHEADALRARLDAEERNREDSNIH